jgi:hypothetical protein
LREFFMIRRQKDGGRGHARLARALTNEAGIVPREKEEVKFALTCVVA